MEQTEQTEALAESGLVRAFQETEEERVKALIPDPRLALGYVHRNVFGIEDFELLDGAREEKENVMLIGPTGSAKTTLFRAYASARQLPICIVDCNGGMEPSTIIGQTIMIKGSSYFQKGELPLVLGNKEGGVILFDEMNLATSRINAAWHQLLAVTRKLGIPEAGMTIKPEGSILMGTAMNIGASYSGTVELNAALQNRFAVTVPWDYDEEVERQLLTSETLLTAAMEIRKEPDVTTPVSTNMLMEYERHCHRYGYDVANGLFLAKFLEDEQPGVKTGMEAYSDTIKEELGISE